MHRHDDTPDTIQDAVICNYTLKLLILFRSVVYVVYSVIEKTLLIESAIQFKLDGMFVAQQTD